MSYDETHDWLVEEGGFVLCNHVFEQTEDPRAEPKNQQPDDDDQCQGSSPVATCARESLAGTDSVA